jgi:hypothetical protein
MILLFIAVFIIPLSAGGARDLPGEQSADPSNSLPVDKIVLFSTGLGFFQRAGEVSGTESIDLFFRTGDVNDLLKSLILQDLDGGQVSSVNYASRESLNVTLGSLAINLSGNPGMAGILSQLRGEEVIIELAGNGGKLSGTVIGIESKTSSSGVSAQYLNLYSKRGIRDTELGEIEAFRFADPFLDSEFRKALALIVESRSSDEKRVSLNFTGEGRRRVLVAYMLAMPVWKTTYRLALGDENEHALQGWAIVENTTDEDWSDVDLTLVSGRPVSFIMDLYRPIYGSRPTVQMQVQTAVAPKSYESAVPRMSAPSARAGAISDSAPSEAFGGISTGFADFDSVAEEIDLSQGVEAAASAAQAGEFFHYAIEKPVSLPRKEAAMVPIINGPIEGERVSIYNQNTHSLHPLNGLRLVNSTGIDLMAGPLTVYESGTYAGDSQIGSFQAGDERLVSFSLDLNTEVQPRFENAAPKLLSVALSDGLLTSKVLQRREVSYLMSSRGFRERLVLIEHPFLHGWQLIEPAVEPEKTANYYRFDVELTDKNDEGSLTETLLVAEEKTFESRTGLNNAGDSFIQSYIDSDEVNFRVKSALRGILDRRTQLAETVNLRRVQENTRSTIHREQDRIRKNMVNLDEDTDLYKQYVDTLTEQENRLLEIADRINTLLTQEQSQRKELESYISELQVEE